MKCFGGIILYVFQVLYDLDLKTGIFVGVMLLMENMQIVLTHNRRSLHLMGCSGSKALRESSSEIGIWPHLEKYGENDWQREASKRRRVLAKLNQEAHKQLQRAHSRPVHTALFLGTGESGKSTVLKQMRVSYGSNFSDFERFQCAKLVWFETLRAMRLLIQLISTYGDTNPYNGWDEANLHLKTSKQLLLSLNLTREALLDSEGQEDVRVFLRTHTNTFEDEAGDIEHQLPQCSPPEGIELNRYSIGRAVHSLWKACPIEIKQRVVANRLGLETNAAYFLDKVRDLMDPEYVVSDDDIMRARIKTAGIVTTEFDVKGTPLVVTDVGGQRVERKNWLHGFDDVTCILFVVAASEYDQALLEDRKVNRLQEALVVFDQTVNSRWFRGKSVTLFFNKVDILEKKLQIAPFSKYVRGYKGDEQNPQEVLKYLEGLFRSRFKSNGRNLYIHQTMATDTTSMKFVVSAVTDMILYENMRWAGII